MCTFETYFKLHRKLEQKYWTKKLKEMFKKFEKKTYIKTWIKKKDGWRCANNRHFGEEMTSPWLLSPDVNHVG